MFLNIAFYLRKRKLILRNYIIFPLINNCSHLHHLHVEVVRYPCCVASVISCVRTWTVPWGQKFAALEQVDSEYEDLVPCQNLAHAISTSEPKRNQSLILDKPKDRTMKKDNLGV